MKWAILCIVIVVVIDVILYNIAVSDLPFWVKFLLLK